MDVWYFFMAVPFVGIAMFCAFGAFVDFFNHADSQRSRNLKIYPVVGLVSLAVGLFLLSL
ncbi:hypothetical protein [Streptomyces sp. NPDC014676]|uniref:hypothetical protein n=1 Tax=Streptomyces sp. NPDC014676 TaxID=3364879 RepID=UPI0036F6A63C